MKDKIPYSKVDRSINVPSAPTSTTKSTNTNSGGQNGKGSRPRPYSNLKTYGQNHSNIKWSK
jgi:hypothetical protein